MKNSYPRDIDGTNIGYTGENTERSQATLFEFDDRLDIGSQVRGDFKETFNMGKFMDPTYEQKIPPILMSHWNEIVQFQKQCHALTLKVLLLFALALDVRIWSILEWQ